MLQSSFGGNLLTYLDVIDTAIKIGLGAFISAISGYVVLCKTNSHAVDKEKRERFYAINEEKKAMYVEFLSQSHQLVYEHIHVSSTFDTPEYFAYLKSYNHIQVIGSDDVRVKASELFDIVNQFILLNKNNPDESVYMAMRQDVNVKIGVFQAVAKIDTKQSYTVT
ncbi:hypothetical protein [Shewanella sp. cp20]|uniref:hypothetical protein n=1 Tax=Shewanella sp. cp20 TaxID=1521167 RepID=UPI0005A170B5|nr:hypothetical protein [Shewanella sp. cp20]KIO36038.1 hypothetical protein DB48_12625 [Shewanella sp. cp20]